jgi:hypothetical protein
VSTPENASKNRRLFDEARDVMRLYKEKMVAVTILSNSNNSDYPDRRINIITAGTAALLWSTRGVRLREAV